MWFSSPTDPGITTETAMAWWRAWVSRRNTEVKHLNLISCIRLCVGIKCFPLKISQTYLLIFLTVKLASSTSKTLVKEGVKVTAGFKRKSRLSLALQLGVGQGVFVCLCAWGDSTGEQQSNTAEVCVRSESCRLFICSLLFFSSGHWPVPGLVPSCAGRLLSQRQMWSSRSVSFLGGFLILQ